MPRSLIDLMSHPVRLAILRTLAEDATAGLAELAAAAGVHENTARAHVGALELEGAVERSSVRGRGRGRPRTVYRLAPGLTLPAEAAPDPAGLLDGTFRALGFEAATGEHGIELRRCPCPRISPNAPELVCALAGPVADGVLAAAGAPRRVVAAQHDPERRSCSLRFG